MRYYRRRCSRTARTLSWDEQRAAKALRDELKSSKLTVEMVPSRRYEEAIRGALIRVVVEENAPWYKKFCAKHQMAGRRRIRTKRAGDTAIRRQDTIIALEEMMRGCVRSVYAQRLLPFVRKRAQEDKVPF